MTGRDLQGSQKSRDPAQGQSHRSPMIWEAWALGLLFALTAGFGLHKWFTLLLSAV